MRKKIDWSATTITTRLTVILAGIAMLFSLTEYSDISRYGNFTSLLKISTGLAIYPLVALGLVQADNGRYALAVKLLLTPIVLQTARAADTLLLYAQGYYSAHWFNYANLLLPLAKLVLLFAARVTWNRKTALACIAVCAAHVALNLMYGSRNWLQITQVLLQMLVFTVPMLEVFPQTRAIFTRS